MQKILTLLMFDGKAEEAMDFYISLFKDSKINSVKRYGPNQGGAEGSVMAASFSLNGQEYMCIDSSAKHDFTFTSAMSLFVKCDTEYEIDELYNQLSNNGTLMMPLGAYPFSKKFTWLTDKFGVSWQLSLV